MTMTRGLGGITSDPGIDVRVRRALDRLSKPYLLITDTGVTINDEGKIALRLNGTTLSQGADGARINPSGSPVVAGLTLTGMTGFLYATAGVVSAVASSFTATLNTQTASTGNTAATETTLFTYTVPANTLGSDGDVLDLSVAGTYGANGNADKRIRVYFGGTMFYDSGNQSPNSGAWSARARIFRVGSASQKCEIGFNSSYSTLGDAEYATAAEDLTGSVILKITGSGTSVNDVLGECWKVVKVPA